MKKIKDIEQRAWGTGHRAESIVHSAKGMGHRVRTFVERILCVFASLRDDQFGVQSFEFLVQSSQFLLMTNDHCPVTSSEFRVPGSGFLPMTNDQCPMTTKNQQITKKPLQKHLHGSRYKSVSCLPREEFNSSVYSAAAAITEKCPVLSSLQVTLPGELNHPKLLTCPMIGWIHNKIPDKKVREDLPM